MAPVLTGLAERTRAAFRARVSGDPTGAPDWVRDIARVGTGLGGTNPTASSGGCTVTCPRSSAGSPHCSDKVRTRWRWPGCNGTRPIGRIPGSGSPGTARWLVVSTFGSAELAEREAARVRGMHRRVRGTTDDGRPYSAGDPELLRWVHLAFTDAFLAAHAAVGRDMSRFGRRWPDAYVREWARSAQALGATDLPTTESELAEALAEYAPVLEPVPADLLAFLSAPPGLSRPERIVYAGSRPRPRSWSPPRSRRWPACRSSRARAPRARPARREPAATARDEPGAGRVQPLGGGRAVAARTGSRTRLGGLTRRRTRRMRECAPW